MSTDWKETEEDFINLTVGHKLYALFDQPFRPGKAWSRVQHMGLKFTTASGGGPTNSLCFRRFSNYSWDVFSRIFGTDPNSIVL
jgi:hypothetical protein